MIKIRYKTTVCTVEELQKFLAKFDRDRPLDTEFFELFKSELSRLNSLKRVRKHRSKNNEHRQ